MSSFNDYGFKEQILTALKELGFEKPTPIQAQTIPYLLSSKNDLIGLAQTGTGKTAAFGLPILEQINSKEQFTQCIILSPTRELCVQIAKDMSNFAKHLPDVKITAVYGGASIEGQIRDLKKGTHIIAGTPGRVLDLINKGVLKINKISFLVLDEADEMLHMGFKEDIDAILGTTPKEKQTLLFSATMPPEISKIAKTYMNSPQEISVASKNSGAGADNVEHNYYLVNARNRYLALKRIADINPDIYGIVFCRTRKETQEVADKLIEDGYNADALHGDLSQAQRDHVMQKFRGGYLHLLVATDVAARGIDVNNLTHIINYNLPDEREVYIHRSGRTGRAGKKGISISIIHSKEMHKIRDIEKILKREVEKKQVPGGTEICNIQLLNMIDKIEGIETIDNQIQEFLPVILKKLSWLDRDELIKRFVSVEFNRFLKYYKNAPDLNIADKPERQRNKRGGESGGFQFSKFYLSLGAKDGLNKLKFMDLINRNDELAKVELGKIEILPGYTLFEADSSFESQIFKNFNNKRYAGKRLKVEIKENNGDEENTRSERRRSGGGNRGSRNRGGSSNGSSRNRGNSDNRSGRSRSGGNSGGGNRSRSGSGNSGRNR